jgi:hypothetical protein
MGVTTSTASANFKENQIFLLYGQIDNHLHRHLNRIKVEFCCSIDHVHQRHIFLVPRKRQIFTKNLWISNQFDE